jgi:NitT/TauT family transport system substrate-binding protein
MNRRDLIVLLIVAVALAGTAGWIMTFTRPVAVEDLSLIEAWHSVYYTPQYVALHKNFFIEQGLNVHLQVASSDAAAAEALASGTAEIALCSMEQALLAAQQPGDQAPIAFALLCQRDGTFLFTRQTSSTEVDWNLLRNKAVIAGPEGDAANLTLESILRQQGIQPGPDVKLLYSYPRPTAGKAFADGTASFAQLYEPSVSQLEQAKVGGVLTPLAPWTRKVPLAAFHSRAEMVRDRPETLQKFTNAICQALRWIDQHAASEIATTIAPSFPDVDLALLTDSIERYMQLDVWGSDPSLNPRLVDDLQDLMIQTGRIERAIESDLLFTTAFTSRAVATRE